MGAEKAKKTFRAKELGLKIPVGLVKNMTVGRKTKHKMKDGKIKNVRVRTIGKLTRCTTRAAEVIGLQLQKTVEWLLEACKARAKPNTLYNASLLADVLNDKSCLVYGIYPNKVFGHYRSSRERPASLQHDDEPVVDEDEQPALEDDPEESSSSSSSSSE